MVVKKEFSLERLIKKFMTTLFGLWNNDRFGEIWVFQENNGLGCIARDLDLIFEKHQTKVKRVFLAVEPENIQLLQIIAEDNKVFACVTLDKALPSPCNHYVMSQIRPKSVIFWVAH